MVRLAAGGDPLKLSVDWRTAPDPIACCELLLSKLSLSQLNRLHTFMQSGQARQQQPALHQNAHACTLDEFRQAYHQTLNSAALQKYSETIDERLAVIFKKYDVNGDGTLSFDELTILKHMLHSGGGEEDGGEPAESTTKPHDITIYNEMAISIDWEPIQSLKVVGEVPEWPDCSGLKYHAGVRMYSVCWRNDLILFDVTGEDKNLAHPTAKITGGHSSPVITSLYVPHVKRLFTCGTDRTIMSWVEPEAWARGERVAVGCAQVSIVYDPSLQLLFSGGTDGSIYLYPTIPKFSQPVKRIDAHQGWVNDLLIIPDLECLVSCSADSTVKFFSTATLELRTTKSHPQYTSGLNIMDYCRKDRTIYTAISGREVLLWSPFLAKPADYLRGHDKPIVGLMCFDQRPEVITVDLSGKICIWDMRTTNAIQTLGSPDSPAPIGMTHSFTYNHHLHAIVCLGDRSLNMFVPQQGSCSALLDSLVSQILYDSVHKSIICSSGSRVVVFELTTGETRHAHNFGGVEISAMAVAVQQQLIIGTEEGKVIVVHLGSWQQSVNMQLKDSVRLVVDLGKKSRLSATGECPKGLALTARGVATVFAYGSLCDVLGDPMLHINTGFIGLELASYSFKHGLLFMSRKQMLEVWDVIYQARKTSQVLPGWITAVTCVDELDATIFGTSDGCLHCFQSVSCVATFLIKLAPTPMGGVDLPLAQQPAPPVGAESRPSLARKNSWWGQQSHTDFIATRIAFDRLSWTLSVMSPQETKLFAVDSLMRRIEQYHMHASIVFGPTKTVSKKYTVDLNPLDMVPCYTYQCRSTYHPQVVLTLIASRATGRDSAESHLSRLQRMFELKKLLDEGLPVSRSPVDNVSPAGSVTGPPPLCAQAPTPPHGEVVSPHGAAASSAPQLDFMQLVALPVDMFPPGQSDKVDAVGGRHVLYLITMFMPSNRRCCPTKHFPHVGFQESSAPGAAASGSSKSLKRSGSMRRGTITSSHKNLLQALQQQQQQTAQQNAEARAAKLSSSSDKQHSQSNAALILAEIKWMLACIASALQELHKRNFVALCHPNMVRFVAPYYTMFLDNGVWNVGEDASGALESHLMPPEGLLQVSPAADMWLLGLLLFKCVTGSDLQEPGFGSASSSASPSPLKSCTMFDVVARVVKDMEEDVLELFRSDAVIVKLLKRLLSPQPLRRIAAAEVLQELDGFCVPPRHLLCVPLQVAETRHEVFALEEADASIKCRLKPALENGEYNCVTVCEVPTLLVLVEFDGQSAHVVLWNHRPSIVGVTPPNSSIGTTYNVSHEEINSVRHSRLTNTDLTLLDDPSIMRRGVYRVEKYCPFFTEKQVMDKKLGKVVEQLPLPYYLEHWHRTKTLRLDAPHASLKQRDTLVKQRWDNAAATSKTTCFEKILLTASDNEPSHLGKNQSAMSLEDKREDRLQAPSKRSTSGNTVSFAEEGAFLVETQRSSTPVLEVSKELDVFLCSRALHPHWGKPLVVKSNIAPAESFSNRPSSSGRPTPLARVSTRLAPGATASRLDTRPASSKRKV